MTTALVWLRNDVRFQDQQSFFNACKSYDRVVAYYTFEPKDFEKTTWGFQKTGKFRTRFNIETLQSLQLELKEKNITLIVEKRSATVGIPHWIDDLYSSFWRI